MHSQFIVIDSKQRSWQHSNQIATALYQSLLFTSNWYFFFFFFLFFYFFYQSLHLVFYQQQITRIMLSSFRGSLAHYKFVTLLYFFQRMFVEFDNGSWFDWSFWLQLLLNLTSFMTTSTNLQIKNSSFDKHFNWF